MKSSLSFFPFRIVPWYWSTNCLVLTHKRIFQFFVKYLWLYRLYIKFHDACELSFVWSVRFRLRWLFFLVLVYPLFICSSTFIDSLLPFNCFCISVKNQLGIFMWVYFWVFYSIPLFYVSIPPPTQYSLNYYGY